MSDNSEEKLRLRAPGAGRPRRTLRRDQWHVYIDNDVSLYFRMRFVDPLTGSMKKGELSNFLSELLRERMLKELADARKEAGK